MVPLVLKLYFLEAAQEKERSKMIWKSWNKIKLDEIRCTKHNYNHQFGGY